MSYWMYISLFFPLDKSRKKTKKNFIEICLFTYLLACSRLFEEKYAIRACIIAASGRSATNNLSSLPLIYLH